MISEITQTEFEGLESTTGQTLKYARQSKGLTEEQIADQLNLSVYTIIDIESDNYDALPVMTYVRGYIVSYCRILGLDPSEVLAQLEQKSSGKKSSERKINTAAKSAPFFTKKKLFIALLLAAAAISAKYVLPLIQSISAPVETTSDAAIIESDVTTEKINKKLYIRALLKVKHTL